MIHFFGLGSSWSRKMPSVNNTRKTFNMNNIKLHMTEGALRLIAQKSMAKNTGARGLRSIMERILTEAMFEVPDGKTGRDRVDAVLIDEEAVGSVDTIGVGAKKSTQCNNVPLSGQDMDECIVELGRKLRLTEVEKGWVDIQASEIQSDIENPNFILVGELLMHRDISLNVLRASVLKTLQEEADMQKVLRGSPWHYENNLLALAEYNPVLHVSEYSFDHVPLWIQCDSIPLGGLHRKVARIVGNKVGEVLEIDID
ncbi:CLP protease regulatory subunit CLPX2, mitochondrial-like protein [Drosera capensis]